MWGKLTSIDLQKCNLSMMQNKDDIYIYVDKLCRLIKMVKYGNTIIEEFGSKPEVAGYSMVQLIETSSITAHFANESRNIYIDIFSCAPYCSKSAAVFSSIYFQSHNMIYKVLNRP